VAALGVLPALQRINLSGNPRLNVLASFQSGRFAALEALDLSFARLEPRGLQCLAGLPRLQELDISGRWRWMGLAVERLPAAVKLLT
jgi:hypothetical protein